MLWSRTKGRYQEHCMAENDKDRKAFREAIRLLSNDAQKDRKEIKEAVLRLANTHAGENLIADFRQLTKTPDSSYDTSDETEEQLDTIKL